MSFYEEDWFPSTGMLAKNPRQPPMPPPRPPDLGYAPNLPEMGSRGGADLPMPMAPPPLVLGRGSPASPWGEKGIGGFQDEFGLWQHLRKHPYGPGYAEDEVQPRGPEDPRSVKELNEMFNPFGATDEAYVAEKERKRRGWNTRI